MTDAREVISKAVYQTLCREDLADGTITMDSYVGNECTDYADAILSALNVAGYKVEEDWRPIETAPRNGKWVLLWWPNITDVPFTGYFSDGKWRGAPGGDTWSVEPCPTHWRPLPAPPVTKGEEQ